LTSFFFQILFRGVTGENAKGHSLDFLVDLGREGGEEGAGAAAAEAAGVEEGAAGGGAHALPAFAAHPPQIHKEIK